MQSITRYDQACDYLSSFVDYERTGFRRDFADALRFNTIEALVALVGNPHQSLRAVHIAGTKGKGSVAAMIEAGLRQAGYVTGLYTSPHLVSVRERIRINGRKISCAVLVDLTETLRAAVEQMKEDGDLRPPTFFEIYTALGLMAFARAEVDVVIVEAGLGGRLDATNIISPLVSVITSIDLDHTEILGETAEQIASEKAGIIKPSVPVVSAEQPPEVRQVLACAAQRLQAPLSDPPAIAEFGPVRRLAVPAPGENFSPPKQSFALAVESGQLWLESPLLGRHQAYNAAVAYGTLALLADRGFVVTDQDFAEALTALAWPGRFQIVGARPWLVLDCAHNPASARALAATLHRHLAYQKLVLVLGISADKDVPEIVKALGPAAGEIIVTAADNPRAVPVKELQAVVQRHWDGPVCCAATVPEALELAGQTAANDDAVCLTGSFFVVGEAMEHLSLEI